MRHMTIPRQVRPHNDTQVPRFSYIGNRNTTNRNEGKVDEIDLLDITSAAEY
jgi:hypothetical protein